MATAIVRADPQKSKKQFGGGRMNPAQTSVSLGMADRVDTLEAAIQRVQGSSYKRRRRAQTARRRLGARVVN